ncbi:MAG: YegP family protein [Clostridia bacterium]|nr:YegP family protein [Clostridia bacterium]
MDKIKEYLSSNPQYVTALIVTAVVLLAACLLGYFIKKYDLLRFMDGWFKKKNKPDEITDGDDLPEEDAGEFAGDQGGAEQDTVEKTERQPEPERQDFTDEVREETDGEDISDRPQNSDRFSELIKKSLESEKTSDYDEDKYFTPPRETPKKQEKEHIEIPPAEETEQPPEPEYEGKWRIMRSGNTYVAELHNDADVLLLRSDHYSLISGAKNAIENLKKNVKGNNFTIAVKGGKFFFKLFSPSGRLICQGEPCATRNECKARIEEVKRLAFKAEIVRG